jgi:hypothetical protein
LCFNSGLSKNTALFLTIASDKLRVAFFSPFTLISARALLLGFTDGLQSVGKCAEMGN